jgi:hypothetical protein
MSETKRSRKAIGPDRPRYLDGADTDKLMAIILALASEVASLRERLDTHERIGAIPTPELVEAYQADPEAEAAREAWRDGYIRRLFRVITEDVEGIAGAADPT